MDGLTEAQRLAAKWVAKLGGKKPNKFISMAPSKIQLHNF